MSPITDERRAHRRHLVLLKVAVRDEKALRSLHATNLSRGGVFVSTRKPLELGSTVKVRLVHPVTSAHFDIAAEVVNCRKDEEGAVRGCGLQFTFFDEATKGELSRFVEGVIEPREDPQASPLPPPPEEAEPPPDDASPDKLKAHALMLRGMALARKGNLVGAAHLLARAVSLDPEEEGLWRELRRLEKQLETAAATRTAAASPDGRAAAGDGDEPATPSEPAVLESAERRRASLLFDAARKRYVAADFDGAIELLEKAVELAPDHAPALYALAGLLTEREEAIPRALELCRRAVALAPSNEDYRDALASLEELAGGGDDG